MSKFKEILAKLFKRKESSQNQKITPAEMDLASYRRREYLDNVKRELRKYRYEDNNTLIMGQKIEKGSSIISAPNVFNNQRIHNNKTNKKKNLLQERNMFFR